jgi:hypothetical protein
VRRDTIPLRYLLLPLSREFGQFLLPHGRSLSCSNGCSFSRSRISSGRRSVAELLAQVPLWNASTV